MGRETENQWRRREATRKWIAELAALPEKRRADQAAARVVSRWEKRRDRGAEPLFVPTIGAAIRARKPILMFYCPGCEVVGELDLCKVDRYRGGAIESLIPFVSCRRCSPSGISSKAISVMAGSIWPVAK